MPAGHSGLGKNGADGLFQFDNVFLARQPVVAVANEGHDDVVRRHVLHQLQRVPIGHIRIAHALQNMHRAARLDRPFEDRFFRPSSMRARVNTLGSGL